MLWKLTIIKHYLQDMILVFTACGLCNKATFIGDEISDTDFYDIAFEQMNSTHSHNIDMDAGENIKVKIISKSGDEFIQNFPVYVKEIGRCGLVLSGLLQNITLSCPNMP